MSRQTQGRMGSEAGTSFKVGDHLFYGLSGVCRVADIREERTGALAGQTCFVLRPVDDPALTLYVPIASEELRARMRPLLTREAVEALIGELKDLEGLAALSDRERNQECTALLASGDCRSLARLVRVLFEDRQLRKAHKKLPHQADHRLLTQAERLLHGEIAFVLGIRPEDVPGAIAARLAARGPGTAAS